MQTNITTQEEKKKKKWFSKEDGKFKEGIVGLIKLLKLC